MSSEQANKKKSSPSGWTDGFQSPSQFESEMPSQSRFEFGSTFWDALNGDPTFKENLEHIIEKRVEGRIAKEAERVLAEVKRKGYEEGLQEGLAASVSAYEGIKNMLSRLTEQMLSEREKLLHQHEKLWCEAFLHLLKRFLVPKSGEIVACIREWIVDSIKEYSTKGKIKIRLSPGVSGLVSQVMSPTPEDRWKIIPDKTLNENEISCEVIDGGGIFHSQSHELKELEKRIHEFYEAT